MSDYRYNQNQQTWQAEESSSNCYSIPTPPGKPGRKPHGKLAFIAGITALCVVLSAGAGIGGAALTYHLMQPNQTTITYDENSSESEEEKDHSDKEIIQNDTENTSGEYKVSDVTGVVRKSADTVVEIVTESVARHDIFGQYTTSGAGSGVIISDDGYIVTNHHVIAGATQISVTLRNGSRYTAELVASDAQSDLAVIRIDAQNLPAAKFADSDKLEVGQAAIAIGNPLGSLGGSVSLGILSALDREITIDEYTMTLLQTDAAINPGNSGGGLFDENGTLIGIVNAKSGGENIDGLGFAIPANLVKTNAEQLIKQGYVSGRINTGLSMIDIPDRYTAFYYGVSRTGVYIQSVTGKNAEEAGLRPGDCIVAVGEAPVSTVSEFNTAIKQYSVGDSVRLTVIRGSKQGNLNLILDEYTGGKQ